MNLKAKLVPVGEINEDVLSSISKGVETVFDFAFDGVVIGEIMFLPSQAYDPKREQYRASSILKRLSKSKSSRVKVLGVTAEDLYSRDLNFVFGQAQKPGDLALISLHRLKPEFWGDEKDKGLFLKRAVKEAVHELGHTFGLDHCDDRKCVMTFSNRIGHTDRKKASFCERCEKKIEQGGG